jgi:hypothetical protein
MKKPFRYVSLILFVILASIQNSMLFAESESDHRLQKLIAAFVPEYGALKLPMLGLSYVDNLQKIQDLTGIKRQQKFFEKYRRQLLTIDRSKLDSEKRYQFDTLIYEVNLEFERLRLQSRYKRQAPQNPIPTNGIIHLPHGREWYSYFIKRWTSSGIS